MATLFQNARIFTPVDAGGPRAGGAQGKLAEFLSGALLVKDGWLPSLAMQPR